MRTANQARLASSEPLEEKTQLVNVVMEVKEVGEEKETGEGDLW